MATFYNQATLSYNDTVTNSNIVSGEIVQVLTATKTAIRDTYRADDVVTYVVSVINSGSTPFTNLIITDDLGAYDFESTELVPLTFVEDSVRYYVNGVLTTTPAVTAGPPLVINGLTVPANGNILVVYQARANSFAPLATGAEITNTVTITATGLTSPVTASETITAESAADLTITKSLNPDVVSENGQLTYTFVIQNFGNVPLVATDNAVVTDTFDPILDPISVTFNGTVWTEPANYTYDSTTGVFTTVAGQITVPAATYTQDPVTGVWITQPGTATLRVTGTV